MKEKEYKPERVTFMASPRLIEIIKDYQHNNRIDSRGETIRRLIELGLNSSEKNQRK